MRILFVSLIDALWGGSEALWSGTAAALRYRNHTVCAFFAYYKKVPQIAALEEAGCALAFGSPPPTRWWKRLGRTSREPLARFERCLLDQRPDLVVFSQAHLTEGLAQMDLCRRHQMPYAILNQLVEPWSDPSAWSEARMAFRAARNVWFVSAENRETATAWLACALPHAGVVPNLAANVAPPSPWPNLADGLRLACVSRMWPPQKGQDLLIDAVAEHAPLWRKRQLRIRFYGTDHGAAVLRGRTEWRGCADRFEIAGFTAAPAEIWRKHHALILPSRFEGQSVAMLEAMLQERPVLVTPVGGTRDLVRHGENGFIAPAIDIPGIQRLLEDAWLARDSWPELGREASRSARRWMGNDTAGAMADRIEAAVRA